MNCEQFQERLISRLKETIRNGELTERRLAFNVGISQPHIHRVLKGEKALSLKNLDVMLMYLTQNLLDFCNAAEIQTHLAKLKASTQPMVDVPVYSSEIGPGCNWQRNLNPQYRRSIPCETIGRCTQVVLARLAADPAMRFSLQAHTLALLATDEPALIGPSSLYAIDRGQDAVIRRLRRGLHRVYLVTDGHHNQPLCWEALSLGDRSTLPRIIGRVIWMGTDIIRRPATSTSSYRPEEATSSYAAST